MRKLTVLLAALGAAACTTTPASAPEPVIELDAGRVRGGEAGEGVQAFKGIPFAAPPIGVLRWQPPKRVEKWAGIRPATEFGASCIQTPFPGDMSPARPPFSEDCLFLNVWRPVQTDSRRASLPVLVIIHGGGLTNGGASSTVLDGANMAKRGIVVVTFNYRLGRFGFFTHPALVAEHDNRPTGNFGFMDQVAVLEWVHRNIASFGGDPSRVTIAGESAGAVSVQMLMTSPRARGLFSAAIAQSSVPRAPFASQDRAIAAGLAYAASNSALTLEELRKLSAERVASGVGFFVKDEKTYVGPVIDDDFVVDSLVPAFTKGRQAKVPAIFGANGRELGMLPPAAASGALASLSPGTISDLAAAYDPGGDGTLAKAGVDILSDQTFAEPARAMVRLGTASGQKVWTYRFDYVAKADRATLSGAPHASDVAYTMDTLLALKPDATADDLAAAKTVGDYWANFVRSHDPNGPGLPAWPNADRRGDPILLITTDSITAQTDPRTLRFDALKADAPKQ